LNGNGKTIAVTSIGLDGEEFDQIYGTPKPQITIYEGMFFVTVEKFFAQKTFSAEILNINGLETTLGKIVTARAISTGKVILSGAADTHTLRKIIAQNAAFGADITIVDGATSRLSLASPTVTDAMILATGAAVSANIEQLTRKTAFVVSLVSLPAVDENLQNLLSKIEKGLWCLDKNGELYDLQISSSFLLKNAFNEQKKSVLQQSKMLFCSGAVSDNLLKFLILQNSVKDFLLIVKDFTKLFITPETYNFFTKKGGQIKVLHRTKLIAVTVNPTSPEGFVLNSEKLQDELRKKIDVAVFDVRKIEEK
jgi:hypothetical protein